MRQRDCDLLCLPFEASAKHLSAKHKPDPVSHAVLQICSFQKPLSVPDVQSVDISNFLFMSHCPFAVKPKSLS